MLPHMRFAPLLLITAAAAGQDIRNPHTPPADVIEGGTDAIVCLDLGG